MILVVIKLKIEILTGQKNKWTVIQNLIWDSVLINRMIVLKIFSKYMH